jgi:hypothetical protein
VNHIIRAVPTGDRSASLVDCDDREHDSYQESKGHRSKCDPLTSCRGFATGNDVFCLQRCRLCFLFSRRLREPLLGSSQVVSTQREAIVFAFVFPLNRTGKQAGVGADPI